MRNNNMKKILALALLFTASSAFAAVTKPGAPRWVTATADGGTPTVPNSVIATVTFSPPASNGGATITSYTVSCSPACTPSSGPASPIRVGGLTEGTAYTFTVTATNSAGAGAASAASNSAPTCVAAPVADPNIFGYIGMMELYSYKSANVNTTGATNCDTSLGCDGLAFAKVSACSNMTGASLNVISPIGPGYDSTVRDVIFAAKQSGKLVNLESHINASGTVVVDGGILY